MNIRRALFGFFYTLVSSAVTIMFYLAFSPLFSVFLPALKPTHEIIFFSPLLSSLMDYLFLSGWIWILFWGALEAIMLWIGQIFLKEQTREEYYV